MIMYADDAAIVYSTTDITDLNNIMEADMKTLSQWFNANKLTLNLKKQNA